MYAQYLESQDRLPIYKMPSVWGKVTLWCSIAILAVSATLGALSVGILLPFVIIMGVIGPFIGLRLSKWTAKRAYKIQLINIKNPGSSVAQSLVTTIESLASRVGLEDLPEIGVYESEEMNAFATGPSSNNAMIAVSSGLLENMGERELTAILAHEIAHVANGDMVALAAVQGVVNMVVIVLSAPFIFIDWFTRLLWDGSTASTINLWIIRTLRWVGCVVLAFLGDLVVKTFSRHREFKADQLAAMLVDRQAMVDALSSLSGDENLGKPENADMAAFMIASPPAVWDIFSTHPSIERRISKLKNNVSLKDELTSLLAVDSDSVAFIDLTQAQGVGASLPRPRYMAAILALFGGIIGLHKFYQGSMGWGIVFLCTCWIVFPTMIIGAIDAVILIRMSDEAYNEKYAPENRKAFKW